MKNSKYTDSAIAVRYTSAAFAFLLVLSLLYLLFFRQEPAPSGPDMTLAEDQNFIIAEMSARDLQNERSVWVVGTVYTEPSDSVSFFVTVFDYQNKAESPSRDFHVDKRYHPERARLWGLVARGDTVKFLDYPASLRDVYKNDESSRVTQLVYPQRVANAHLQSEEEFWQLENLTKYPEFRYAASVTTSPLWPDRVFSDFTPAGGMLEAGIFFDRFIFIVPVLKKHWAWNIADGDTVRFVVRPDPAPRQPGQLNCLPNVVYPVKVN